MIDLGEVVLESARRHSDRPALVAEGGRWTYRELVDPAGALAELLRREDPGDAGLCAVHAERSFWAYAGILGILLAGRGYVPLGPSFPADRNRRMLERSGAATIVADRERLASLEEILTGLDRPVCVVAPDVAAAPEWVARTPHRVLVGPDLPAGARVRAAGAEPSDTAYLLFTSGTTGTPKGIGITQSNVSAYLEAMGDHLDIGPGDRCSQNFSLTFDLSVHDMFVCWSAGGCLCVPPPEAVMAPARFVRDEEVTHWFSTPSTAGIMMRLRMLRPGAFPALRSSLFCGEALTGEVAEAWARAAPESVVENLYGPTEATIACTAFRYVPGTPPEDLVNGVVPIGQPFGRTRVRIVDASLSPLPAGEVGELLLGGDQLAPGYWRDPQRSASSFVSPPALGGDRWYRTGDLASLTSAGELVYHGRADDQIKIRGHRVELQEIEAVVRGASRAAIVVAMGWPRTPAGADGVVVFVSGAQASDEDILGACRGAMPGYMVPSAIHRVESVPQNASGKVDRSRLIGLLESVP